MLTSSQQSDPESTVFQRNGCVVCSEVIGGLVYKGADVVCSKLSMNLWYANSFTNEPICLLLRSYQRYYGLSRKYLWLVQGSRSPKYGAKIRPHSQSQKLYLLSNSRWKIPDPIKCVWFRKTVCVVIKYINKRAMMALGRSPEYQWNQIISKSVHRFSRSFKAFFLFIALAAILFNRAEGLSNFCRQSPKEHSCIIISKSMHWLRRRSHLKVFLF